jgi:hypothetical protein
MIESRENLNPNIRLNNLIVKFPEKVTISEKTTKVVNVFQETSSKKRRYDVDQSAQAPLPLAEKKVVTLQSSPVEVPVQTNPVLKNPDIEMIEWALGGTEHFHVEKFEKEHGHTMQAIVDATVQELAALRQLDHLSVGFGGFKKAGIKKWKFLVKLNDDGKITELAIGKFKIAGGYTKVYFTLDKKVILVPQKARSTGNIQLINSHKMISHLYNQYLTLDREGLKQVLDIFPPLPKKTMIGERPILVAPQAVGDAKEMYNNPPTTVSNVIERLEVLRDAATCLSLCHAQGIIHGDIKPPNILISEKQKGLLHDFGGGCIFYSEDTPEEAGKKFYSVSLTNLYIHYRDFLQKYKLIKEGAAVSCLNELGQASDVFSLGVSAVEALIGRYDVNGVIQAPFTKNAYHYCNVTNHWFPYGPAHSRQEVIILKGGWPIIDGKLQALLDGALELRYERRISAGEFCKQLDTIIIMLKSVR